MPVTATRGRFVWHELSATDPQAAIAFYKDVIGWGTSPWGSPEMEYTMWLVGDTPVGGVMQLPQDAITQGARPMWLAYVEVPDVDEVIAENSKLGGGTVFTENVEQVGRFAVLRDPQGAIFGVITNANPMPEEIDPKHGEFSWHELACNDWKSAGEFYAHLFGWENKGDADMGEMGIYSMFGRDRFTYGGIYNRAGEMPPPNWLHYVLVDSADAAADRAVKAGGKLIMGPMDVPGDDRVAILLDPQGAAFAVHSKPAK